jgi:hypothetical protein
MMAWIIIPASSDDVADFVRAAACTGRERGRRLQQYYTKCGTAERQACHRAVGAGQTPVLDVVRVFRPHVCTLFRGSLQHIISSTLFINFNVNITKIHKSAPWLLTWPLPWRARRSWTLRRPDRPPP